MELNKSENKSKEKEKKEGGENRQGEEKKNVENRNEETMHILKLLYHHLFEKEEEVKIEENIQNEEIIQKEKNNQKEEDSKEENNIKIEEQKIEENIQNEKNDKKKNQTIEENIQNEKNNQKKEQKVEENIQNEKNDKKKDQTIEENIQNEKNNQQKEQKIEENIQNEKNNQKKEKNIEENIQNEKNNQQKEQKIEENIQNEKNNQKKEQKIEENIQNEKNNQQKDQTIEENIQNEKNNQKKDQTIEEHKIEDNPQNEKNNQKEEQKIEENSITIEEKVQNEKNIQNDKENSKKREDKKEEEIKKEKENKAKDEIKNEEENKDGGENEEEEINEKEDEKNKINVKELAVKIIGDKDKDKKQKLLLENEHSKINKIIMENACISEYLNNSQKFESLKSFNLKNGKLSDDKFLQNMPNLTELSIKSISNLEIDFLKFLPINIQKLCLEKNNFVNQDFKNIINFYISNNEKIAKNLKCLSFAGNNLTRIDLSSPKNKFEQLIELDFRKNKICKIFISSESFPKLKFVNCCKNCLNKSYLKHLKNVISLESVNGHLLEPELSEPYYEELKKTLMNKDKVLFKMEYLNISHMPRVQSLQYFKTFEMVRNVTKYLIKLDLSYNKLDNETFFKFININKKFENLRILNLNGNDIDDHFFEEETFQNVFCKLEHLYLNSNKIGDKKISIKYKDNISIDDKYHNPEDKSLIYKLRAIYNFIQNNKHLTKLTITKNPISEFYSVVPEIHNNADKSEKYIKKDNNGKIIINCLFSLCIKIRDELLTQDEERDTFNLRFDCRSNVNKNSSNYPYKDKPFVYKIK